MLSVKYLPKAGAELWLVGDEERKRLKTAVRKDKEFQDRCCVIFVEMVRTRVKLETDPRWIQ